MEAKRPRGRPRMGMIDDVLDEIYGDRRGRLKTERVGEFGSQGPALGQRTNDDDDDEINAGLPTLITEPPKQWTSVTFWP